VATIIRFIKKLLRHAKPRRAETTLPVIDENHIIQRNIHQISKTNMSANALTVLNRLNSSGYQAYLVGGSVRDLLLHKAPKDFDIATDATPNQIRKLFRNARIIGRRFKLAHILFHREIIEVATFRGSDDVDENHQTNDSGLLIRDNVYGTLEEDAWRRDFTVNSLYYTLTNNTIVDYTSGFQDVHDRVIRMIGEPSKRYKEDPVRMLRAIRFSGKLGFTISPETAEPIGPLSHLIAHISSSRLFEEMVKLYQCGKSELVHEMLIQYGLFSHLFSQTSKLLGHELFPVNAFIKIALQNTDKRIQEDKPVTPAFVFAVLLWFPMLDRMAQLKNEGVDPLPALEQAMSLVITEQNKSVTIPKRFTQVMREIWLLQFRFEKRSGHRAFGLLEHPRFRAAYDFMALRALAGDEEMELADWWTTFQEVPLEQQEAMVNALSIKLAPKQKKPRAKKKPVE
jgi:poly(A) polymerase